MVVLQNTSLANTAVMCSLGFRQMAYVQIKANMSISDGLLTVSRTVRSVTYPKKRLILSQFLTDVHRLHVGGSSVYARA